VCVCLSVGFVNDFAECAHPHFNICRYCFLHHTHFSLTLFFGVSDVMDILGLVGRYPAYNERNHSLSFNSTHCNRNCVCVFLVLHLVFIQVYKKQIILYFGKVCCCFF